MSLRDLIRGKRVPVKFVTATVATIATPKPEEGQTVANVATVAVANATTPEPASPISDGAGNTRVVSYRWRFQYRDREPKEAMYTPAVNHAEALSGEPDAISAEPFEPTRRRPDRPLNKEEQASIGKWLASIGETDVASITTLFWQCNTDEDERRAFLRQAIDSNDKKWGSS